MIVGSEHYKPSATVLLVEGDVLIRMPVAEYLRECGYRVMEAANVDEAVAVLDAAELQINVIFVSLTRADQLVGCKPCGWRGKSDHGSGLFWREPRSEPPTQRVICVKRFRI